MLCSTLRILASHRQDDQLLITVITTHSALRRPGHDQVSSPELTSHIKSF